MARKIFHDRCIVPSIDNWSNEIKSGFIEGLEDRQCVFSRIGTVNVVDLCDEVVHDIEDECLHVMKVAECIIHRKWLASRRTLGAKTKSLMTI